MDFYVKFDIFIFYKWNFQNINTVITGFYTLQICLDDHA